MNHISPLCKYKKISGSMLKLIATLAMLIDHAALILAPAVDILQISVNILGRAFTLYYILRKIGRLAFPFFCFLIVEGFLHTRNKYKYAFQLLVFAFLSEIPFNLMMGNTFFYSNSQNVFFTLFLGFVLMYAYQTILSEPKRFLVSFFICIIAVFLKADYGLKGVLLIFLIYLLREQPTAQAIISYPLLSGGIAALSAFLPINLYNGTRGFIKTPFLKFLFYIFYPIHILLLVVIRHLLLQSS